MGELPRDLDGWRRLVRRVANRTRYGVDLGSEADAEDYAQAAYLKMGDARDDVRDPSAFLVKTAVNISINDRRRSAIRTRAAEALDNLEISDDRPLQDEVLLARERLERVTEGLARLSARTRQVFLLHRVEGLKYREIADLLGITPSAVEKHIAKATAFLAHWTEGW
jgi:RNA polymerase sigma-70 factor (ECF subfamily)